MNKSRLTAILSAAATALSMTGMTGYAADTASEKTVDQMLSEMTTKQKVEQMIAITLRPWTGGEKQDNLTSLNPELTKLIREHNFSGVTLFAPNIESAEQCAELTDQIQQAALSSECGIPMLICADQEGGSIYRIETGTLTCGNMANGAAGDPALAEENAKILGNEMKSVGINTDLAPVLDVNNNPANPVINVRSFSSDPKIVSEMGASYLKGLQSEGVITTCKHFPGHGDTNTDSHTGLPLINKNYDELKNMELYPYDAAIKAGTDMIMTAHIQFPKIETETYNSFSTGEEINIPATLSKTIITDILRNDLGFDGIVITDSMLMDAIQVNFDRVDAAVLAMNADVDIILEPMAIQNNSDIEKMEKYIDDIVEKVEAGTIPEETVDRSVTRILKMKKERGILDYTAPDKEKAIKTIGSAEHRERALQIAEKAVTLIKNDDDILPLELGENGKIAYFYPYANVENTMVFTLDRLKKEGIIAEGVTSENVCFRGHNASEYEDNIKNSDVVILALEMYSVPNLDPEDKTRGWQGKFAEEVIELSHKNGKKVIYLSANIPYDIARFPDVDAIVAVYNASGMSEIPVYDHETLGYGVNYPAGLITILGGNSPTGKLPVDVYAFDDNYHYTDEILYPIGYGLTYKSDQEEIVETSTADTTTTDATAITTTITATITASDTTTSVSTVINSTGSADSPDTGADAPSTAVLLLALAGFVAARCKKNST